MNRTVHILTVLMLSVMVSCNPSQESRENDNEEIADRGGRAAEVEQDHDISVEEDLLATIENIDMLGRLYEAARVSGVFEELETSEDYTLLAPANVAFEKAKSDDFGDVPDNWTEEDIKNILSSHIIKGNFDATILVDTANLVAINGAPIQAISRGQLLQTDIQASNGTIHVIDTILTNLQ